MKTFIRLTLITALIVMATDQCFAMMDIRFISPAKAKELGVVVRAQPNGPNQVWVQMDFKAEGELKDFLHVSLEIQDGEKYLFGWSALQTKKSESGIISVASFIIDRAFLEKVTLRIVAGDPLNYSGNDLRLKDFVDVKNLDTPPTDKKAGAKADASPLSPAPAAATTR